MKLWKLWNFWRLRKAVKSCFTSYWQVQLNKPYRVAKSKYLGHENLIGQEHHWLVGNDDFILLIIDGSNVHAMKVVKVGSHKVAGGIIDGNLVRIPEGGRTQLPDRDAMTTEECIPIMLGDSAIGTLTKVK
jgi:hypothetical protein